MFINEQSRLKPRLDESLYSLQPDERAFFQQLTGIQDEDELKEHIITVQTKAYDIYDYPCIRRFLFIRLNIARLPAYNRALKLLQDRKDPILLDIGCCFGNDIRKAVVDGWPVENAIASDLHQDFWDYGHELFKSTPETFPAAFIPGDVFDPNMLSLSSTESQSISTPLPPLKTLKTLTHFVGRLSAIHATSFFHLFSEERQLALAHRLAALLVPTKGSIIFGQHRGRTINGFRTEAPPFRPTGFLSEIYAFCHSPESWRKMWEEDVFGPNSTRPLGVKTNQELIEVDRSDLLYANQNDADGGIEQDKYWVMKWSVEVL